MREIFSKFFVINNKKEASSLLEILETYVTITRYQETISKEKQDSLVYALELIEYIGGKYFL